MRVDRCGARRGGRLKEAKIVRQSRMVKRVNVGRGTARGGSAGETLEATVPKRRVKELSL
jgi:hypothetical protein